MTSRRGLKFNLKKVQCMTICDKSEDLELEDGVGKNKHVNEHNYLEVMPTNDEKHETEKKIITAPYQN